MIARLRRAALVLDRRRDVALRADHVDLRRHPEPFTGELERTNLQTCAPQPAASPPAATPPATVDAPVKPLALHREVVLSFLAAHVGEVEEPGTVHVLVDHP